MQWWMPSQFYPKTGISVNISIYWPIFKTVAATAHYHLTSLLLILPCPSLFSSHCLESHHFSSPPVLIYWASIYLLIALSPLFSPIFHSSFSPILTSFFFFTIFICLVSLPLLPRPSHASHSRCHCLTSFLLILLWPLLLTSLYVSTL